MQAVISAQVCSADKVDDKLGAPNMTQSARASLLAHGWFVVCHRATAYLVLRRHA